MGFFRSKKTSVQDSTPTAASYSGIPSHSRLNALATRNDNGHSVAGAQQRRGAQSMPALEPIYRSLSQKNKEIRLLQLQAGQGDDKIRVDVRYTNLYTKKQIQYETVSYHWAKNDCDQEIEINGTSFRTSRSAFDVLHRVRYPDKDRMIWIDAICIHQTISDEKNQQVAMMGEIYRSSKRNIVWLGGGIDDPARVCKAVNDVLANARKSTRNFKDFYRTTHPNSLKGEPSRDGNTLDRRIDFKPLEDLFASSWFGRIWVVQEAALAPRSICHYGTADFQLSDLLRVALWLRYNASHISPSLTASYGLARASEMWYLADHEYAPPELHFNGCRLSLAQVYMKLQDFDATKPHDRIYASLGFLVHQGKIFPSLAPNYDRPKELVFRDVTRAMIAETRRLDIFRYLDVGAGKQPAKTHSWVVPFDRSWREERRPEPLRPIFYADRMAYSQPSPMQNSNPDILVLYGFDFDVIKIRTHCMFKTSSGGVELRSTKAFMGSALRIMQQMKEEFPSRKVEEEMATTLMGGANPSGEPLTPQDVECYEAYVDYVVQKQAIPPIVLPWEHSEASKLSDRDRMAIRFMGAAWRACSYRRFFVTDDGRMGIGPGGLQEGDCIAVLKGSRVPFALRWWGDARFSILGECYVHGIMEGQMVAKRRVDEKEADVCVYSIV